MMDGCCTLEDRNFDPTKAAEALYKAIKGLGTNETQIINVLTSHCNAQRQDIDKKYKTAYGRALRDDLKGDLSGNFLVMAIAMIDHPRVYDAKECYNAIKGLGTDENTLIEILCTRSNSEIKDIRSQYKALFDRELDADIKGDTSGDFKRLLISQVTGNRQEGAQADPALAKKEADELYKAGEKKWGTDEAVFNRILTIRSYAQLRATFDEYRRISGKDIEDSIKSEMGGSLQSGCLALVKAAKNEPAYFAERLYKTMKGVGTDDRGLIRLIVSRSEVDMVKVKEEFNKAYGKTLGSFIRGDTSGDYKRTLVALIGEK